MLDHPDPLRLVRLFRYSRTIAIAVRQCGSRPDRNGIVRHAKLSLLTGEDEEDALDRHEASSKLSNIAFWYLTFYHLSLVG